MEIIPKKSERKSIFRSLLVPLILIMILQAALFYLIAVYGGIEYSLNQNAADILSERLNNRKNEIEVKFNNKWSNLEDCSAEINKIYKSYEDEHGYSNLTKDKELQKEILGESADILISTLRQNEVNGIFLILSDSIEEDSFLNGVEKKYGLCIRDMDQESNYNGREDLLLERSPSSIVEELDCSLNSGWEAQYSFDSKENGSFYYYPMEAAWKNPNSNSKNLAYVSDVYQISNTNSEVFSYSIPLMDEKGYPYGVLGVELSVKYLTSLMPNRELNDGDKCCYVLAIKEGDSSDYSPIATTGSMYVRCFESNSGFSYEDTAPMGGFYLTGSDNTEIYGQKAELDIYDNNNPFEDRKLNLIAMVEDSTMFIYSNRIKMRLLTVSLISLALGVVGIAMVSRRFAAPISALAKRVRGMKSRSEANLGHIGIAEIDQLVDSIENLNKNVNRNSARTEFFSRMSHDMRTPMNAIISFSSQDLLEGATEEVKDDYLRKINSSGRYLLGLINEVLDMTKIESNKTDLQIENVQACNLFESSVPIIEKIAQKKNVDFASEIKVQKDLYVEADRLHLNQVVVNLLSNAVKFTPKGGSVCFLSDMTKLDDEGKHVICRIIVSDSGIGMSPEFMKNLYMPFEQENSRIGGTGLGLSIAKKLVELMNGEIECSSVQNQGTTFTVTVPLLLSNDSSQEDKAPEVKATAIEYAALGGKRILVCEDNSINMQIICLLLEKMNIKVEKAEDGRAGVGAFRQSPEGAFDAVLMDVRMPVMDGLTAAREIRALGRKDSKTIPIIAMTANAFEEDMRQTKAAGMNAHLTKPVEPKKLYDTLIEFIAKQ